MAVPRNALKKWEKAREFALGLPDAVEEFPWGEPAGYGLGKAGWVGIPLEGKGAPAAEVLCEWVEESYRVIAPKRLIAVLDGG
ncbi:hypothetical protein GCM10023086_41560 [Streptomyces venetus]|uniref:MmcQ/YjbR family DNA-binding protein n=1 Tax=Streptomyces venetus TaxID=1701086 RepID=A0ABP8G5Z4_9ACTN